MFLSLINHIRRGSLSSIEKESHIYEEPRRSNKLGNTCVNVIVFYIINNYNVVIA